MVIMCRQRDAENNDMIKSKPIYFLMTFLMSVFMASIVFLAPASADDGHGGAPGHLHQLPHPCDDIPDSDACNTRYAEYASAVAACDGDQACIDRARESWHTWLDEHDGSGSTYQIGDEDTECTESADLSFDWGGGDCTNTRELITLGFRLLAGIVGIAVVGGITWGGILYTTSNGNASKAQQGITTIVNSVIGLLLFIFLFALANFLVPGGVIG